MSSEFSEISKIERELDLLRQRYSSFSRGARLIRPAFVATCLAAVGGVAYGIFTENIVGAAASFLVLGLLVAAGIANYNLRPIDIVSGVSIGSFWHHSEAAAIEKMIEEREERLAALKKRVM